MTANPIHINSKSKTIIGSISDAEITEIGQSGSCHKSKENAIQPGLCLLEGPAQSWNIKWVYGDSRVLIVMLFDTYYLSQTQESAGVRISTFTCGS